MHDLVATLRRIAGTQPAKTPAGLLVTAGQLRHLADEIEQLLGRVDHLGRSRDEALEAVESLQARVGELQQDAPSLLVEHPDGGMIPVSPQVAYVVQQLHRRIEAYSDLCREAEAQTAAARTELGILRPMVGRLQESAGLARIARETARPMGWAIGTHGSLVRDLDLIAVPWRDDAAPIPNLIEAIAAATKYEVFGCPAMPRRGGRWSVLLKHPAATFQQTEKGTWTPQAIDLSISDPRRSSGH